MNGVNHCGAYLEHLQCEHHHLNSAVLKIRHQLEGLLQGGKSPAKRDSLIDQLEELLRQLHGHFREEEEEEGLLEEAVARCRSVRPNVKALMCQHQPLAQELERLIVGLKRRTVDGETCQQMFESFAAKLKAHECTEDALLQFALGGQASEYDVEGNE